MTTTTLTKVKEPQPRSDPKWSNQLAETMWCYNGYLSRLVVFLAAVKTFVSGGRVGAGLFLFHFRPLFLPLSTGVFESGDIAENCHGRGVRLSFVFD